MKQGVRVATYYDDEGECIGTRITINGEYTMREEGMTMEQRQRFWSMEGDIEWGFYSNLQLLREAMGVEMGDDTEHEHTWGLNRVWED